MSATNELKAKESLLKGAAPYFRHNLSKFFSENESCFEFSMREQSLETINGAAVLEFGIFLWWFFCGAR